MSDHEIHTDPNTYWRDKIQDSNSTLAATFITVVLVGICVAAATGVVETLVSWLV